MRLQIKALEKYFEEKYIVKTFGIVGCELVLSHFLVDSTYLEELSANFMSIVRHIGTYVSGDGKLLRFIGESNNVRAFFSRAVYQLIDNYSCNYYLLSQFQLLQFIAII